MATYERIFAVVNVGIVHLLFQVRIKEERAVTEIERRGRVATGARLVALERAYANWQVELEALALATAEVAKTAIRDRLKATAKRPDTGVGPHLSDLIVCRPVQIGGFVTGAVGVADEDKLNEAVNPFGPQYGPYWRTQEYGSPKMQGRILYGAFYDTGGGGTGFVPDSGSSRAHPLFMTAAQGSTVVGRMVIQHPAAARHFIRDGADIALAYWRKRLTSIERTTVAQIEAISAV